MAYKVLLVEDEEAIRQMYDLVLKKKGFEVDLAEDGEIAIQKLTQGQPNYDVVLLDIMLPKFDGISVLKAAKEVDSPSKNVPVYMLTNLGQEELIKQALELGAERYWVKTNIFPMDLIEKLSETLSGSGT